MTHAQTPEPSAPVPSVSRSAPPRASSPVPLLIVGLIAVVALGLSAWALSRPTTSTVPAIPGAAGAASATYSDADRAAAKSTACAAFETVRAGVSRNTNLEPPGGPGDATGTLAVAANARLSLSNGGFYLLARIPAATPADLAEPLRTFADNLIDIGAAAIAGALNSDPEQAARLRDIDAGNKTIVALCK